MTTDNFVFICKTD